ncbi:MAG: hypothetical protein R3F56_04280 [Planctomycetota bacterium]
MVVASGPETSPPGLEADTLVVGLLVSTIGFSLFLYGKKQGRLPQAITGLVLMVLPLLSTNAWLVAGISAVTLLALRTAVRAGH